MADREFSTFIGMWRTLEIDFKGVWWMPWHYVAKKDVA